MSLYSEYLLERTSIQIIEKEHGFITYSIVGNECYIRDLYVRAEHRKSYYASSMANEVSARAKEAGCTYLLGSVCPTAKNSTASLKVLLAYGMHLVSSTNDLIFFKKEIE